MSRHPHESLQSHRNPKLQMGYIHRRKYKTYKLHLQISFFLREFQTMVSASDDNSLLQHQDTNWFFV